MEKLDSEHLPNELAMKVHYSLQIITDAINKYRGIGLAFSFNGGKDCTVLLHLLNHAFRTIPLFYEDSNAASKFLSIYFHLPNSFQEMNKFVEDTVQRYGLRMKIFHNSIKEGFQEAIEKDGVKAIFLGTRRTDPGCEKLQYMQKTDEGWPDCLRVNPILDWNYHDIWTFIKSMNLHYCLLYDHGYTSIGYTNNTFPNQALKRSDGTYEPAYMLKDGSLERSGR